MSLLTSGQRNSHDLSQFWYVPALWWITWFGIHTWILERAAIPMELAVTDSLVHNATLAVLCSGCFYAMRYTRPDPVRFLYAMFGLCLVAFGWANGCRLLLGLFFPLHPEYLSLLADSGPIRTAIGWLMLGLFVVLGWLLFYVREHLTESIRVEEMRRISRESELQAIRYQMHPHFLFNTLNSVGALVGIDPPKARRMILLLSEFLRSTLKKDIRSLVPLSEELEQIERYLEIEQVRFGARLQTSTKVDPGSGTWLVPPILLQPLIENAIKHGLYGTLGDASISLEAQLEADNLVIRVSNPYDANSRTTAPGTGFGLETLHRRLYLFYGRHDLLATTGKDGTFTVTVRLPQTT